MHEILNEPTLKEFLSNPRTPLPVHATSLYDGQTNIALCVKFINRRAVSALISRGDVVNYRIDKVRDEWILPDAWKGKAIIKELLQFIEREECKHDAKAHVA